MLLRRWLVADAEALARAVTESQDHLQPWMAFMAQEPQTLEQRRAMLREREREWLQGGDVMLGIFVAGDVAGSCGLHRRRGPSALEIGYWLHPAFTGRGLATAVARLLTDAAFSAPGVTHVEIHTDKANAASSGVPRRLGFHFLGETPDEATTQPRSASTASGGWTETDGSAAPRLTPAVDRPEPHCGVKRLALVGRGTAGTGERTAAPERRRGALCDRSALPVAVALGVRPAPGPGRGRR